MAHTRPLPTALPGRRTLFHWHGDGTFSIETREDVEAVVRANRAAQNDGTNGFSASRNTRKIGEVPLIVIHKWMREDGIPPSRSHEVFFNSEWIRKHLMSPDWSAFRTTSTRRF